MKNRVSDKIDNAKDTSEDLKNSELQMELATALVDAELECCERKIKFYNILGLVFALLSLVSILLAYLVSINFLMVGIFCCLTSGYFSIKYDIEKVKRNTILSDKFTATMIKRIHELTFNIKKSAKKEKK